MERVSTTGLARALRRGIAEGVDRQIANGAKPGDALRLTAKNIRALGAYLASPDFNLVPIEKVDKSEIEKQALLKEMVLKSAGSVRSQWPTDQSADKQLRFIETHKGSEAPPDVIKAIPRQVFYSLQFKKEADSRNTVGQFLLEERADFSVFHFMSWVNSRNTAPGQSVGGYCHEVTLALSKELANRLVDFILHEDPNIVYDVYKALFPENNEKNKISLSPRIVLIKTKGLGYKEIGEESNVPPFTPRACE